MPARVAFTMLHNHPNSSSPAFGLFREVGNDELPGQCAPMWRSSSFSIRGISVGPRCMSRPGSAGPAPRDASTRRASPT